ncbi:MAG: glycosyltransferase family 4 protein [Nitrososphaerales archaeon]|jgi:glycosyltransferase involved in cell wall biosynthesis
MKIVMVNRTRIEGGKGVHVRELSKALVRLGHSVTLIPRYQGKTSAARYFWKMAKGYDVIHVHEFDPAAVIAALLAKRVRGSGTVLTVHQFGPPSWYHNNMMRRLMRSSIGRFDAVISVSDQIKGDIIGFLGRNSPNVVTIYNGVDTSIFNPSADPERIREKLGIKETTVILYVGRLIPRKGVSYLLQAFRDLRSELGSINLVICGEGETRSKLEELARSLGVENEVIFSGFVSDADLPFYYAACDICVVPSISEPMGIVLLEAMSMMKPVVATNVGGIPEIVQDSFNGLLVPPRDSDAISHAIKRLLTDKDLSNRLASNGRKVVEDRFSWSAIASDVSALYAEAVN